MRMFPQELYAMDLGDFLEHSEGPVTFLIYRVPGGWIYHSNRLDCNAMTSVFVPFSDEFEPGRF